MNLIKKLPDGTGIPRLVDLAYNTGFITDDKNGLIKRGVISNSGLLMPLCQLHRGHTYCGS